VARALLGKGVGDEIEIDLPEGRLEVAITGIIYG
jgi:transcription elongation GreA/GreB family factor